MTHLLDLGPSDRPAPGRRPSPATPPRRKHPRRVLAGPRRRCRSRRARAAPWWESNP